MQSSTIIHPVGNGEEQAYRRGLRQGIERGLREGFEKGIRSTLIEILHSRGIELNALDRRQIAAETSIHRMRQWMRRALAARTAGEVFGQRSS